MLERWSVKGAVGWTQRSVWLDHYSVPESGRYECNVSDRIFASADISSEKVADTLRTIVSRYEALRTVHRFDRTGEPMQVVLDSTEFGFDVHETSCEDEALRNLENAKRYCFNIEYELPIRATVVRVSRPPQILVQVVIHHIAVDATAMGIVMAQLREGLGQDGEFRYQSGGGIARPLDLVSYEESLSGRECGKRALRYWQETAPRLPFSSFPYSSSLDPSDEIFRNCTLVSSRMCGAALSLARTYRVPPSVVYQSAVATLLAAYNQQPVVSYKMLSANRNADNIAFVGCLFLPAVVCVESIDGRTFEDVVRSVFRECQSALRHSYVPYDRALERVIREKVRKGSDLSLGPVVNCLPLTTRKLRGRPGEVEWHPPGWEYLKEDAYIGVYIGSKETVIELNVSSAIMSASDMEGFLYGIENLLTSQLAVREKISLDLEDLRRQVGFARRIPDFNRMAALAGGRLVSVSNIEQCLRLIPGVDRVKVLEVGTGAVSLRAAVSGIPGLTPEFLRMEFVDRMEGYAACVCPDQFVIVQDGWSGEDLGTVVVEGSGRNPVRTDVRSEPERVLVDSMGYINGLSVINLESDYVSAGGMILRAPRVAKEVERLGYRGIGLDDLLSIRPLYGIARKLV